LCIELQKWDEIESIERIGLEMLKHELLGVELPKYVLPVSSGRNLATIIDTAVRQFLLRSAGFDSASKLVERHSELLTEKKKAG
jgi:HPr kinase/phosphorylase